MQVQRVTCPGCRVALPRTLGVVALIVEGSLAVLQQASRQDSELVLADVSVEECSPAGESGWVAGSSELCRCVVSGDDRR